MKTKLYCLSLAALLLTSCATPVPDVDTSAESTQEIALDGVYGSIRYAGELVREVHEDSIVIRVKTLELTFVEDARFNRTPEANLSQLRLVATDTSRAPAKVLYEDFQSIEITLSADSPKGELAGQVFTFPKHLLDDADHIGLALLDSSRMLWPIDKELK